MNCKNCGAVLAQDDKFCPICGLSTSEENAATKCEVCGAEMTRSDRFCPSCGSPSHDVNSGNPDLMRSISSGRIYKPKRRKTLNVKLLLMLLLILLASTLFLWGTVLGWWKL
jgi:Predicted membrane protein